MKSEAGCSLLLLLLVGWCQVPLAADGLGRLLTSPEERRLIAASLGNQVEETEVQLVRFEGVMEVEGGRLVVWVNGSRIDQPGQLEQRGMVLVARQAEPLHLAVLGDDGILHRLMPGQVFDRATNRILEPWEVEETPPGSEAAEKGEQAGGPRSVLPRQPDPADRELQHLVESMRSAMAEQDGRRGPGRVEAAK